MKMKLRIFAIAAVSLMLASCFKDVAESTRLVLQPYAQAISGDVSTPLEGCVAYSFAADTTEWGVESYDEALNGIITRKLRGEKDSAPLSRSEVDAGGTGWISLEMKRHKQMLLVVDTENRRYAYTQLELPEHMPVLYMKMTFNLWKEGFSFSEGKWSFYNDFYDPPKIVDCFVDMKIELNEGGEVLPASSSKANVYAYAADTTFWYIASYDDANAGIITMRDNPEEKRQSPNYQGYYNKEREMFKFEASSPQLMIVAVDRANRIFAYTQREIDLEGGEQSYVVLFRPWLRQSVSEADGWVFVDSNEYPETPPEEGGDENGGDEGDDTPDTPDTPADDTPTGGDEDNGDDTPTTQRR